MTCDTLPTSRYPRWNVVLSIYRVEMFAGVTVLAEGG